MKRLLEYMSPVSWLYMHLASLPPIFFILRPSLKELAVLIAVDSIALFINRPVERKLFERLYPDTKAYLGGIDDAAVARMSDEERGALYESFTRFPGRRARYSLIGSFIKCIPAYLVIVFYWRHSSSNWTQLATVLGINLFTFWYLYGAIFLESHRFLSKEVARLHERHDFGAAFSRARPVASSREFEFQEVTILLFIFVFMLVLQGLIIFVRRGQPPETFALELAVVGLLGIALFFRVWQLGKTFQREGLERIFGKMSLEARATRAMIPLHTDPVIGRFGRAFNEMTSRLRRSEGELSLLILNESDKQRFRALGQMSALVAHDLTGPLHVTRYCARELVEILGCADVRDARALEYASKIHANSERASELVTSMRARLKDTAETSGSCRFGEAHENTLNLIRTQFPAAVFERIAFRVDPELMRLEFAVARSNLIHVLDNLYRNGVRALLDSGGPAPGFEVRREEDGFLVIDNGPGLSPDRFESLTAYHFDRGGKIDGNSLGLRLTRRLVETCGGSMTALAPEELGLAQGAVIRVRLPRVPALKADLFLNSDRPLRVEEPGHA